MKFSPSACIAAVCATAALALTGCVVAPVGYDAPAYGDPAYVAPPGVVYVAPTYAMPGPGYLWQFHVRYGWGWYHPSHGWHRGWR